jgi:hypothetical protein
MFYDLMGVLLDEAARILADASPGCESRPRQRRQAVAIVRGIAAALPDAFSVLAAETSVLECTLADARTLAHGCASAVKERLPEQATPASAAPDPLARHRDLLVTLAATVRVLHADGDDPAAREALVAIRRGLVAAAEVQGRLVDAAFGRPAWVAPTSPAVVVALSPMPGPTR